MTRSSNHCIAFHTPRLPACVVTPIVAPVARSLTSPYPSPPLPHPVVFAPPSAHTQQYYHAAVAGLSHGLSVGPRGLSLSFSGYAAKVSIAHQRMVISSSLHKHNTRVRGGGAGGRPSCPTFTHAAG
jgi:hypothetical protein